MSNKMFTLNMDDFYLILAIIFWFIGCLFSLNHPAITLSLYGVGLAFCYCAYKVIFGKIKRRINDIQFNR